MTKKRTPTPKEPQEPPKKRGKAAATPAPKGKTTPAKKAPAKKAAKPRAPKKAPEPEVIAPAVVEPEKPVDLDADTADDGDLCGLPIRAARFIDIYLSTMKAAESYVEAGYTAKNANTAAACASRLLSSAKGRAYLAKRAKAMFERNEEEQDRLLQSFSFTAYADPRELVEHYRGACRYCHGKMNRYQYTSGEWDKIMSDHVRKQEKAMEAGNPVPEPPDAKGGVGFNRRAEPNPDCPECAGEGEGRTVVKDTRHLSPAALALYAGVKEGKDGIEVKMHDQAKARETLAKIRQLYDDGTKVAVAVDVSKLDATYSEIMRKAHEQAAQVRRERFGEGAQGGGQQG